MVMVHWSHLNSAKHHGLQICGESHVNFKCLMCFIQILVHGVLEATQNLAEYCRLQLPGGKVFSPRINETVDATTDGHIYQVNLVWYGDSMEAPILSSHWILHLVQEELWQLWVDRVYLRTGYLFPRSQWYLLPLVWDGFLRRQDKENKLKCMKIGDFCSI